MGVVGWFISLNGSLIVPPPLVEKTILSGCWLKVSWPYICRSHFPGGSDGKASAYNAGDPGSILGSGRSPGEVNGNPLSILAWKIPWTEEPVRLQPMPLKRVGHD